MQNQPRSLWIAISISLLSIAPNYPLLAKPQPQANVMANNQVLGKKAPVVADEISPPPVDAILASLKSKQYLQPKSVKLGSPDRATQPSSVTKNRHPGASFDGISTFTNPDRATNVSPVDGLIQD